MLININTDTIVQTLTRYEDLPSETLAAHPELTVWVEGVLDIVWALGPSGRAHCSLDAAEIVQYLKVLAALREAYAAEQSIDSN